MTTAIVDFDTRSARDTRPSRSARPVGRQAAGTAGRPSETWGSVRLTRRGRAVVLLVALAAAFGIFTMVSGPADSTGEHHAVAAEQVVVEPGQSLWDIATAIAPDEDPRVVIDEIVDLNALESSGAIQAGQPLYVPQY
jgi:hypothetical protein